MQLQMQILAFLEANRNDFLTFLLTSITIIAEKTFLVIFLSVLYWCVNSVKAKRLAWLVLFSGVGNNIVKNIVRMPRPYEVGGIKPLRVETATSSSFPSGHVQSATSFWAGSMMILKTRASIIVGSIMIILVALSRMYLGVHWPMDVLGGIGFGLVCIYFANQMLDCASVINKWHVIGTSSLLALVIILNVDADLYNAAAALWGFCIGALIEQKYIQFKIATKPKTNMLRAVVGIIGVVIIYIGIGKGLPDVKLMSMLKNALVLIWIIAGAPYVFKRWIKE